MEGGLVLLFVIIAMIARAIEAVSKGKQAPPQGRQRPPQRSLPQRGPRPGPPARPAPTSGGPASWDQVPPDATEDAAAAMIPDDLWEILTGRPKPQRAQSQRPLPQPVPDADLEAGVDEEADSYDVAPNEVAEYEQRRRAEELRRARERQKLRERRLRERDANAADRAPKVYSLEAPLPPTVARHAAFHAKIESAPAVVNPARRLTPRQWLFTGDDMKRAIVLQEVLGRPKGLE